MATRKYLMEKGDLALPMLSIPHSKASFFTSDFFLGPSLWVTQMVNATNPKATKNIRNMGRNSITERSPKAIKF